MKVGVLTAASPEGVGRSLGDVQGMPGSIETQAERSRSLAQQETTTAAVFRILLESGHEVVDIPVDGRFMERLTEADVDIAFNTYSGATGRAAQFQVCAVMDLVGTRYTGSRSEVHALGLAKHTTKKVLRHDGLPTPSSQSLYAPDDPVGANLRFPLIVKPAREGSSVGISEDSVVASQDQLGRVLRRTLANYEGPVLVEEFIEGREFTVGVMGNSPPSALPVVEVDFAAAGRGARGFYSHELKSQDLVAIRCPAQISPAQTDRLQQLAVAAFRSLECLDYARVDFRVDSCGQPYILELNTLPGMKEGYSDFPRAAAAAGYTYRGLILALLSIAAERYGLHQ